MSKQRPNADKLANELLGASAFFRPSPRATDLDPEPAAPARPTVTRPADTPSDVVTSRRQSVMTSSAAPPSPAKPQGFDINRPTASRDSLRLAIDETKALDALRQSLRWDFDLTVSKNDICRAALHSLLDDFAKKQDKSEAITRLKRKQTSR